MAKSNYSNIPISKKTSCGMSLNIDDRAFLQRMFTLQDNVYEDLLAKTLDIRDKQLTGTLAEVLQDHYNRVFVLLEEQNKSIIQIREDIKEIKADIGHLTLDIKDIRLEIKALKVETKAISLDIENLTKRIADHEFRINHIEKHLKL